MAIPHDNKVPVLKLLRDLDAGIDAHTAWLKQLHRALVCATPPDSADMASDAHRRCAFGRWFYAEARVGLEQWSDGLGGIEATHQTMHERARALLAGRQAAATPDPADYDVFMDAAILFKTEVRALQFRIMADICLVDHLTGAWNRNSMFQRLAEEQERVARNHHACCLCMMDLDHFKQINDRHGHAAGDRVLHQVVELVGGYLRKYDAIFRYGGEEFLLCLPNSSANDAVAAMDRIRAGLERLAIALPGGETIQVTASFGVAAVAVERSVEENIKVADQALFCAKLRGRNQVCQWGSADPPA